MPEEMKLLRALCEALGFEITKCQISTEKRAFAMHGGDLNIVDSPIYGYKLVPKKKHVGMVLMSSDHYLALVNREHTKHVGAKRYEEIQCEEK